MKKSNRVLFLVLFLLCIFTIFAQVGFQVQQITVEYSLFVFVSFVLTITGLLIISRIFLITERAIGNSMVKFGIETISIVCIYFLFSYIINKLEGYFDTPEIRYSLNLLLIGTVTIFISNFIVLITKNTKK